MDKDNGRTHEPSLRELTAELDGLRGVFDEKIDRVREVADERDRRYEDRFHAMDEKTVLALTSSKEAVNKAEVATEKRFDSVNEFRDTLRDQASQLMSKSEASAKFDAYDDRISEIKKEIVIIRGSTSSGVKQSWGVIVSVIGIVLLLLEVIAIMKKP